MGNYNNKLEMMKILFSNTSEIELSKSLNFIYDRCDLFGVSSDLRFAHFMAQCREEMGSSFEAVSENLNYKAKVLPKLFKAFRRDKRLAKRYGRTKTQRANQVMIANIAYANRLGNKGVRSGDGWKFRGAGSLQVTGRSNFEQVQIRINRYGSDIGIDIVNNENDIHTIEGAILAGLGFWMWKDIYAKADLGTSDDAVDAVTRVINKHTHSYEKRREHFHSIKHLVA